MEWSTPEDINRDVLDATRKGLRYAHLTCGIEFQRECVQALTSLHDRLKELRDTFIAHSNEPYANAAFRAQMVVSAVKRLLEMWILLKEEKPDDAWDRLIEAQQKLAVAQRVYFDADTETFLRHLLSVEEVVFPAQVFLSCGFKYVATDARCTICNQQYGECDHISGRIYMGRICRRRILKHEVIETSIVPHPQDKRCRMVAYTENGTWYCTLTRRERPQGDAPIDSETRAFSGIAMRSD